MPITIDCFKAYDVRGQIPNQLNADVCYRIGNATAAFLDARCVVVRRDLRLSSAEFSDAVMRGLTEAGVDVFDIGLCGTEMVYFATSFLNASGGIMVTASHNPADYNGLKFVREEARPISADTGLADIRRLAEQDERKIVSEPGQVSQPSVFDDYIAHMLSYVDVDKLEPLKLVVNAGNGCAGIAIDGLEKHLPFEFIKVHHEPDGTFPNGIPNPLLPENRAATIEAVRANGADMGIAWDGDFDRCFLFDENGGFIEGYYVVVLLAESILDYAGYRRTGRRQGGAEQVRALIHQGKNARGGRRLRRRDERPSLLPRVLIRRQRHDPVVACGRTHHSDRQAAVAARCGAPGDVSRERGDQSHGRGCGCHARETA